MHKLLLAAGSRVNLAPTRVSATVPPTHERDSHVRYRVTVFYDQLLKKKAIKKKGWKEISLPRVK